MSFPSLATLPAFDAALLMVFLAALAVLSLLCNCGLGMMIYFIVKAYHRLDARTTAHLTNRSQSLAEAENNLLFERERRAEEASLHLAAIARISRQLALACDHKDTKSLTGTARTLANTELLHSIRLGAGIVPDAELEAVLIKYADRCAILATIQRPGLDRDHYVNTPDQARHVLDRYLNASHPV